MVSMKEQGLALSEEQITLLEEKIAWSLPMTYRHFLMKNNGGRPEPDVIDVAGLPETPTDLQVFFGIGGDLESCDLLWNFSLIRERCSTHAIFPIACDSGGNLFCLSMSVGMGASVVYCELDSSESKVYVVAPSFDKFMEMIKEWE